MLTLTEAGGARLADKLVQKKAGEQIALRFVRHGSRPGWTFRLDRPSPSDTTFTYRGRVVLVVDEVSSHSLRNRLLDVRETDDGPRLRLLGN